MQYGLHGLFGDDASVALGFGDVLRELCQARASPSAKDLSGTRSGEKTVWLTLPLNLLKSPAFHDYMILYVAGLYCFVGF